MSIRGEYEIAIYLFFAKIQKHRDLSNYQLLMKRTTISQKDDVIARLDGTVRERFEPRVNDKLKLFALFWKSGIRKELLGFKMTFLNCFLCFWTFHILIVLGAFPIGQILIP